jgi:hypothetical protein
MKKKSRRVDRRLVVYAKLDDAQEWYRNMRGDPLFCAPGVVRFTGYRYSWIRVEVRICRDKPDHSFHGDWTETRANYNVLMLQHNAGFPNKNVRCWFSIESVPRW